MKSKINVFFQNEKIKSFIKKVLNKKNYFIVIVTLGTVLALRISFSLMFQIKGVVKNINEKNITVVDFVTTKTVNIGDYPIELKQIQVGDKIEIIKNLSGDILYVRAEKKKNINKNINVSENDK